MDKAHATSKGSTRGAVDCPQLILRDISEKFQVLSALPERDAEKNITDGDLMGFPEGDLLI